MHDIYWLLALNHTAELDADAIVLKTRHNVNMSYSMVHSISFMIYKCTGATARSLVCPMPALPEK
jgi:hypothetical protein